MPTQKVGSKKFKGVPKPFRRLLKSILVEMVSPFSFKFTCFLKGQTFCVAISIVLHIINYIFLNGFRLVIISKNQMMYKGVLREK